MIRISNDNLFQVSEQKVQQKYVSSNYIMSLDLYIHISRITLFILLLYWTATWFKADGKSMHISFRNAHVIF